MAETLEISGPPIPSPRARARAWLLTVLWAAVAMCIAAVALGMFLGGVFAVAWLRAGGLGELQWFIWITLLRNLLLTALLPQIALAAALWMLALRIAPALERSWRGVLPGVVGASALASLPVARIGLGMWEPQSWLDVLNTGLLLSAGTSTALLLARRCVPWLHPGALARSVPDPRETP